MTLAKATGGRVRLKGPAPAGPGIEPALARLEGLPGWHGTEADGAGPEGKADDGAEKDGSGAHGSRRGRGVSDRFAVRREGLSRKEQPLDRIAKLGSVGQHFCRFPSRDPGRDFGLAPAREALAQAHGLREEAAGNPGIDARSGCPDPLANLRDRQKSVIHLGPFLYQPDPVHPARTKRDDPSTGDRPVLPVSSVNLVGMRWMNLPDYRPGPDGCRALCSTSVRKPAPLMAVSAMSMGAEQKRARYGQSDAPGALGSGASIARKGERRWP